MTNILETLGVPDFNDEYLLNKCKKLAEYVQTMCYKNTQRNELFSLRYFIDSENDDSESDEIMSEYAYKMYVTNNSFPIYDNLIGFSYKMELSWLDELNVFISKSVLNDTMVVDNTAIYRVDNNGEKVISQTNCFFMKDEPFEMRFPIVKSSEKILSASILFCVDGRNMYSINELAFIIMHELGHLYDSYISKKSTAFVNRDLVNNSFSDEELVKKLNTEFNYKKFKDNLQNAKILNDMNIDLKLKTSIINSNKLNCQTIEILFLKNVYRLNLSEMHQKLKNFIYELSLLSTSEIKKAVLSGNNDKFIAKHSDTYKAYKNSAVIFGLLVKYTPENIKEEYVDKVINVVFNKKFEVDTDEDDNILSYPRAYNKKFGNDKNKIKTFDNFFNFHRKRIDKFFLRNCLSMLYNLKGPLVSLTDFGLVAESAFWPDDEEMNEKKRFRYL